MTHYDWYIFYSNCDWLNFYLNKILDHSLNLYDYRYYLKWGYYDLIWVIMAIVGPILTTYIGDLSRNIWLGSLPVEQLSFISCCWLSKEFLTFVSVNETLRELEFWGCGLLDLLQYHHQKKLDQNFDVLEIIEFWSLDYSRRSTNIMLSANNRVLRSAERNFQGGDFCSTNFCLTLKI